MPPKIIEIRNNEITFITDDPQYSHLFEKEPYTWLDNSLYFLKNIYENNKQKNRE